MTEALNQEKPTAGERVWRGYVRTLQLICAASLVWIVGVTLINVLMRYLLSRPIVWADESARLSFVVFTFLAAGLAAASNSHLAVDSLAVKLGDSRAGVILRWVIGTATAAFAGLLIYSGVGVAANNMGQASPALQVPLGYVYGALPIGGVLILLGLLGDLRYPGSSTFASASTQDELEELA